MSLSLPVSINPKPLSVSRLMVPSAIRPIPQKVYCSVARKHRVQAAPLQTRDSIGWMATINWQQAMAGARGRIWSPGGVKVRYVSLQCIGLRTRGVGWAISAEKRSFDGMCRRKSHGRPIFGRQRLKTHVINHSAIKRRNRRRMRLRRRRCESHNLHRPTRRMQQKQRPKLRRLHRRMARRFT